jgi:hypothetical protein
MLDKKLLCISLLWFLSANYLQRRVQVESVPLGLSEMFEAEAATPVGAQSSVQLRGLEFPAKLSKWTVKILESSMLHEICGLLERKYMPFSTNAAIILFQLTLHSLRRT